MFNPRRPRRSSRPVRRSRELHQRDDSSLLEPVNVEAWSLSDEGSVDRVLVVRERFYSATCGCTMANPVGGQCEFCRQSTCQLHWYTCARCGLGVCSRHVRAVSHRGVGAWLCVDCADWEAPKRAVARLLDFFGGGG